MHPLEDRMRAVERERDGGTPGTLAALVRAAQRGDLPAAVGELERAEGHPLSPRLIERAQRIAAELAATADEMDASVPGPAP